MALLFSHRGLVLRRTCAGMGPRHIMMCLRGITHVTPIKEVEIKRKVHRIRRHTNPLAVTRAGVPLPHEETYTEPMINEQRVLVERTIHARDWSFAHFYDDVNQPLHVDLGCGMGEYIQLRHAIRHMAKHDEARASQWHDIVDPSPRNYLGAEINRGAVMRALKRTATSCNDNVRLLISLMDTMGTERQCGPPYHYLDDHIGRSVPVGPSNAVSIDRSGMLPPHQWNRLANVLLTAMRERALALDGLGEVHYVAGEAAQLVRSLTTKYPGPIVRFSLLFPDPWLKKQQRKRNIMTEDLVEGVISALSLGGDIIIKSDVRWLYRMMLLKIQQHSDQLLRVDDSELFQHHITKYEQAARNSGRYVFAARFVKIR